MSTDVAAAEERKLEPLAVWALFLAAMLLFPIAGVVGIIALVKIFRGPGPRAGSAVLAGGAVFMSLVVAPVAVVAAFNGRGPVTNNCARFQQEGRGTMRVISMLQKKYKKETGRYGTFKEIGFPLEQSKGFYTFTMDWADSTTFVASATGKDLMKRDLMQVDPSEKVKLVSNRCQMTVSQMNQADAGPSPDK